MASQVLLSFSEMDLLVKQFGEQKESNAGQKISEGQCAMIVNTLQNTKAIIRRLGIPLSSSRLKRLLEYLPIYANTKNVSEIYEMIMGLQSDFVTELMAVNLAFIPPDKLQYFEGENQFGTPVTVNFPDAVPEIKCAGNCLAADLNTAAVFHLMRVITIALRETAWFFKIKKIGGKKLEYCRDESILKEIELAVDAKLESVDKLKRDEKWEEKKSFYQGLLTDLNYFKHDIRDPLSHARKSYTEKGAIDIYDHVMAFMQRLAGNITTSYTRHFKKQTTKIIKDLYPKKKSK